EGNPRVAVSGRITAIEIDPTDPNKVYVSAAQGGVYRSLDGGATWVQLFDSAQSLAVGALNLDAANNRLWVGTGEGNQGGDNFAGIGLYRIDNVNTSPALVGPINPVRNYNDGGGSPVSSGFFTGRSITKIARYPNDPNTLLIGVGGGGTGLDGFPPFGNNSPPLAMQGLTKLSNAGGAIGGITGTRVAVSTIDTGQGLCLDTPCTVDRAVFDIVFDPQDGSGNIVIVSLGGTNVAGDGGIYRSVNALAGSPTFTQTFITTSPDAGLSRLDLRAFARGGSTFIYAASGEPANNTGSGGAALCIDADSSGALRRSGDGGLTWSNKLAGGGGFCGGQCFYDIGFAVIPGVSIASDKLLLGGSYNGTCSKQQATSLDGGATEFADQATGTHADTHVIKVAPSNPLIVYRGDDGGAFKSVDGGNTWATLNNATLRATQFQSIALHPTDPSITLGGTQDNGTVRMNGGPTFLHADDGDGGYAMIDQGTPTVMYHTYYSGVANQIGYAVSTSSGDFNTWNYRGCSGMGVGNGISCTVSAVNFYAPTALGPGTPNTTYFGSDRLMRSSDMATNHVTVSQAPLVNGVAISAIGIARQDDGYRMVGNSDGHLWYTTTGSATLTSLDPVGGGSMIPDRYVSRVVFDPTNKNTAYVTLDGYMFGTAAANSHVWKITNLNTTPVLTAINGSGGGALPDVPTNAFAADATDPLFPGITVLYVGTDIGVYQSTDNGANWIPYGSGLPRVAVFDMAVHPVTHVLRIATHGRGLWEASVSDVIFANGFNN
ncbi:MAG: hypothetical protein ABI451_10385, partial [Dokdonella sp.]